MLRILKEGTNPIDDWGPYMPPNPFNTEGELTLRRKQWTKEAAIGGKATSQGMSIASKSGRGQILPQKSFA